MSNLQHELIQARTEIANLTEQYEREVARLRRQLEETQAGAAAMRYYLDQLTIISGTFGDMDVERVISIGWWEDGGNFNAKVKYTVGFFKAARYALTSDGNTALLARLDHKPPVSSFTPSDRGKSSSLGISEVIGPNSSAVLVSTPSAVGQVGTLVEAIDDGYEDCVVRERLARHEGLLSEGWRPTRWRHPFWGDLELVVSDGFWIARLPDGRLFHHFRSDRFAVAIQVGRTEFRRDADGSLIMVVPSPKNRDGDR